MLSAGAMLGRSTPSPSELLTLLGGFEVLSPHAVAAAAACGGGGEGVWQGGRLLLQVQLLPRAEQVVGEPVQRQAGGHVQGEPACTATWVL